MTREEKLSIAFNEYLEDILSKASKLFDIKPNGRRVANSLTKFELFEQQQNVHLVNSWIVQQGGSKFTLCCVEIDSTLVLRGKVSSLVNTQTHKFLYGHMKTRNDFAKSYIRPETIRDKMTEIFQSVEIDFPEHKEFSKKYFCLSTNPSKFRFGMSLPLMNILSAVSPVEIQFSNNECLFKQTKSIIDIKNSLEFFHTGVRLASLLNN